MNRLTQCHYMFIFCTMQTTHETPTPQNYTTRQSVKDYSNCFPKLCKRLVTG